MSLTRRALLSVGLTAALTSVAVLSRALLKQNASARAINEYTAGAEVKDGLVTLTTPKIAENGFSVPVSILVESPMTEDNYVESVGLFSEGNPVPMIANFHFSPTNAEASVSTRIRLAKNQNLIAIARLNNGDLYRASNYIEVTIGGCGA